MSDTNREQVMLEKLKESKERLCSITTDELERRILSVGFDVGVKSALQISTELIRAEMIRDAKHYS